MGEEFRYTVLYYMFCVGWCGCMSFFIFVFWGFRVKIKGIIKEGGFGGILLGDNLR